IDTRLLLFIDRHDKDDAMFLSDLGEALRRWAVRHALRQLIPFRLLLGAEVRPVEQLLKANDLCAAIGSLSDKLLVLFDHRPLDLFRGRRGQLAQRRLNQTAANDSGHRSFLHSSRRSTALSYRSCKEREHWLTLVVVNANGHKRVRS